MFLQLLGFIWDGMEEVVCFFKRVQISSGVSLWTILCCCFVLSVVIAGLVNVVRIGGLSARAISSRRRKGDDD